MAGRFDILARIERDHGDRDAHGNVVPDWRTYADVWVDVEDGSGRELFRAQQVQANISAIVTLREEVPGIAPKDRVVLTDNRDNTRVFEISAISGVSERTPRSGPALSCVEVV